MNTKLTIYESSKHGNDRQDEQQMKQDPRHCKLSIPRSRPMVVIVINIIANALTMTGIRLIYVSYSDIIS